MTEAAGTETGTSRGTMSFLGDSRWAVAANSLTVIRFAFAPVLAMLVLYRNPWWLTFVIGWTLGATDVIDGNLARRALRSVRRGVPLTPADRPS